MFAGAHWRMRVMWAFTVRVVLSSGATAPAVVDDQLATLNHEGKDLENRLAKPLQPADLAQAGKRLKTVQLEIEALEAKWLELSQDIESAMA